MKGFKAFICSVALGVAASFSASSVQADDIDIYFFQNNETAPEPMIMFSIDWRANVVSSTVCTGSSKASCDKLFDELLQDPNLGFVDPREDGTVNFLELLKAVLLKVFVGLDQGRIGLMMNHANENCHGPQAGNSKCTNGGFIAKGFQSFKNGQKQEILDVIKNIPDPVALGLPSNADNPYQGAELFFEFYRYLVGGGVYNGKNGWESFGGKKNEYNLNDRPDLNGFGWDTEIMNPPQTTYKSPITEADACAGIYTINIMFQVSQQDAQSKSAMESDFGTSLSNSRLFEDVLGWMRSNQSVTSYFVTRDINQTTLRYAAAGGTVRPIQYQEDPADLIEILEGIIKEILSVSTTFVSASVPVNVFNRSQILDNVYLALFQPRAAPNRWVGNVKKLRLAYEPNLDILELVDVFDDPAIDPLSGRIKFGALTYWTDAAALPTMAEETGPGGNLADSEEAEFLVAGRDGRYVPRGGSGHKVPGIIAGTSPGYDNSTAGARKLFTQPESGSALLALNASSTVAEQASIQQALGAADADEAMCMLRYARGYDVIGLDPDGVGCATASLLPRKWLEDDILHSRPAPINYGGSVNNPDIRLVFGSNDGYFRMIRNTDGGGAEVGTEDWAFMPREVMRIVGDEVYRRDGRPGLDCDVSHSANCKFYGVDGIPTVYMVDANSDGTISAAGGDKVWVFFGLRRGGKALYGLDITDPDNPSLLWSINSDAPDFAQLGLTFSKPVIGRLAWGANTARPVLIFGGGYYGGYGIGKDSRTSAQSPNAPTDDLEGNAFFVIDAETGDLVWKAVASGSAGDTVYVQPALKDSIPAEPAVFDSTGDSLTDRAYVPDTGGVLWRADMTGADRSTWTLTPVLTVGRHSDDGSDRRFFHKPSVTLTRDDLGDFDGVVIVSGDRANPLEESTDNEIYMFKDRNVNAGSPPTDVVDRDELADLTDNCLQETPEDLACQGRDLTHGWFVTLEQDGEKGLAAPLVVSGKVLFTSYIPPSPDPMACGPSEGTGRFYIMDVQTAGAPDRDPDNPPTKADRHRDLASPGIPSEVVVIPTAGIPGIENSPTLGDIAILPPDLFPEPFEGRLFWKTFWYEDRD